MSYRDRIRRVVSKDKTCLEIGPSYNPIVPKSHGYKTTVFDHLTKEQLRNKYKSHSQEMLDAIEDVDILGSELSNVEGTFDCIVGSHLIEHTPDLIGFLKDCSRLMNEESVLLLIVPDKRHVFDALRPLTSTGNVIDSHILGRSRHVGTIFDTKINATSRGKKNLWSKTETQPFDHIHNFAEAKSFTRAALNATSYIDTHAWCFTPESFRLIIFDLAALEFTDLVECDFHSSGGSEFYFALRKGQIDEKTASRERVALATAALEVELAFNRTLDGSSISFR